jgi:hypothetical protein
MENLNITNNSNSPFSAPNFQLTNAPLSVLSLMQLIALARLTRTTISMVQPQLVLLLKPQQLQPLIEFW